MGCGSLKSVILPDSVKSIGDYAFEDCTSLEAVEIPAGVTSLGKALFGGCTSLGSITVAEGNTKYKGGNNTIIESETNTLITGCVASDGIPDGIEIIGEGAFKNLPGITKIKSVPGSVKKIEKEAFYGCSGLTEMSIGEGVTEIGDYAFYGCSGIKSMSIPGTVESIGISAFELCGAIEAPLTVPSGVTELKKNTFKDCTSVPAIVLPDEMVSIGNAAFMGCSSLDNFKTPEKLKTIGEKAFHGCTSLSGKLDLSSVEEIGSSAFEGCSALAEVALPEITEEGKLGTSIFRSCSGLEKIDFSTLCEIPDYTFMGCTNLPDARIQSVETIGVSAFEGAALMESVLIPKSTKLIDVNAFNGTGIKNVDYPGTEEEYEAIDIRSGNDVLKSAGTTITYNFVQLVPPTRLSVSPEKKRIRLGEKLQLTATLYPGDVSDRYRKLAWYTSDPAVAEVDENGLVTAKSFGEAGITVKTDYGEIKDKYSAVSKIEVKPLVTYKSGYDGYESDQEEWVSKGDVINLDPDRFKRKDFAITGWEDEYGNKFEKDQGGIIVEGDMTFIARWSDGSDLTDEYRMAEIVEQESGSSVKTQVLGDTIKMGKEGKTYSIVGLGTASGLQIFTVNAGSKFSAPELSELDMSTVTISMNGAEGSAKDVKKLFKLNKKKGKVMVKPNKGSAEYTLMIPLSNCTLCLRVINVDFDRALKKKKITAMSGEDSSVSVNLMESNGKTVTENESKFLSAEWFIDGKDTITPGDGTKLSKKGLNVTLSKDNRTLTVANPGDTKKGSVKISTVINGKKYSTAIKAKAE